MKSKNEITLSAANPVVLDPSWDRARELLASAQSTWQARIAFVAEIERLRTAFLHQGQGKKKPLSQVVTKIDADGFQAQLRAQLDLHPQKHILPLHWSALWLWPI